MLRDIIDTAKKIVNREKELNELDIFDPVFKSVKNRLHSL